LGYQIGTVLLMFVIFNSTVVRVVTGRTIPGSDLISFNGNYNGRQIRCCYAQGVVELANINRYSQIENAARLLELIPLNKLILSPRVKI